MKQKNTSLIEQNRIFLWIALGTTLVLSIPLTAMHFKSDVVWDLADFIVMRSLLFGAGSLFVLVARVLPRKYRALIAVGFVLAVLWIWAELAVGVFTNVGS